MLSHEVQLIQSVAQSPLETARYLMSPQVDLGLDWFLSPVAKKFFSAVAELTISNCGITLLSVLSHHDNDLGEFNSQELQEITGCWREALKIDKIDLQTLVKNIKTEAIRQRAGRAIAKYQDDVSAEPHKVVAHLDSLGSRIALLSHDGIEYDANPRSHLDEPQMIMRGSWGSNSVLDKMFSRDNTEKTGGKPAYGLAIASLPTGHGKSSLGITMAAYSLAYSQDKVVIMSNELVRSIYANAVFRALKSMYARQESDDSIKDMMSSRLAIYAPSSSKDSRGLSVNTFETVRKILYWEKPDFAVMDSINGVSAPQFASRMSEQRAHEIKADGFRDTCLEFGLLMYAPGNMSEEHQKILKSNKPDKLQSVMLFGSTAYQNGADWAFLGWRDAVQPNVVNIKRTKNRHGTSLGEKWQMIYDYESATYRPSQEIKL